MAASMSRSESGGFTDSARRIGRYLVIASLEDLVTAALTAASWTMSLPPISRRTQLAQNFRA